MSSGTSTRRAPAGGPPPSPFPQTMSFIKNPPLRNAPARHQHTPLPTFRTRARKHTEQDTRKHTDAHTHMADHMDAPMHARTHGCVHSQNVRAHAGSTGNRPMRMFQLTANMPSASTRLHMPSASTRLHSSGWCPVTLGAVAGQWCSYLGSPTQSADVGGSSEANGLSRSHPACGRRTIASRAAQARTRGVSVTRDLMLCLSIILLLLSCDLSSLVLGVGNAVRRE